MKILSSRDTHIFEREKHDHYVEPLALDRALIRKLAPLLPRDATIYDPCCGFARIVRAAIELGYHAYGADVVPRWEDSPDDPFPHAEYRLEQRDYLKTGLDIAADAIVMNPPYGHTVDFVDKALREARVLVAAIVPATWVNGARTARWLAKTPCAHYWPIAPRPSMPPGEYLLRGEKEGGGTKDFAVLVWRTGEPHSVYAPTMDFLFWK